MEDTINQVLLDKAMTDRAASLVSILGAKLSKDGDQWCWLYGENPQEGVAGFGSSPDSAMCNFEIAFNAES